MIFRSWKTPLLLSSLGVALGAIPAPARASTSVAAIESAKQTSVAGDFSLRSSAVETGIEHARTVGLGLTAGIAHRFNDTLSGQASLTAVTETGNSFSLFTTSYQPSRSITLNEASLLLEPGLGLDFRAGAINQNHHEMPLLFSQVAFPGVLEQWTHEDSGFSVTLAAEQAIPVSTTTSSSSASRAEAMPFYTMERIRVGARLSEDLRIGSQWAHFAYHSLPGAVASESRFLGNTVIGAGPASTFAYEYEGVFTTADLTWRAGPRIAVALKLGAIQNLRAPRGSSRGYLLSLETPIDVNARLTLSPIFDWFRNEADAAPAAYNSGTLAHNNRQGISAGLRGDFKALDLQLETRLVRAATIRANPFQSDYTGILLNLRKSYELL